jgi:hypothetical protein
MSNSGPSRYNGVIGKGATVGENVDPCLWQASPHLRQQTNEAISF